LTADRLRSRLAREPPGARTRPELERYVPTPPGTTFNFASAGDPSLSGISCVPAAGCTAVGVQAQGGDSANLAQSNMGAPS
jgi:hypothetical protein